tara:strand:- start:3886 stop:4086 length:201 start_codon:yes stop_codon:yes gene_type:complete
MEILWLPINGKFVEVTLEVSKEAYKIDGKDHFIVKHDGSGFRYLATADAINKMRDDSDKVSAIMSA